MSTSSTTPTRKPPHCRTCHKPIKGHKRGVCDPTDISPPTSVGPPSRSTSTRTRPRKSAPPLLERVPTISTESSQILHNILRENSYSAPPPIEVPDVKRNKPRRSTRSVKREEELMNAAMERLSASDDKPSVRTYNQQIVVNGAGRASTSDPLTFTLTQQFKFDDSGYASASDPSADVAIQNFLDSMSRSPQHPPATIFSFPINAIPSLEDTVESRGLYMHVLHLPNPKDEWVPVVIGRDMDAITKLLEDGEKLAQGMRRPDRSKMQDLGMSHVVVGALGALATWAGLAYS